MTNTLLLKTAQSKERAFPLSLVIFHSHVHICQSVQLLDIEKDCMIYVSIDWVYGEIIKQHWSGRITNKGMFWIYMNP